MEACPEVLEVSSEPSSKTGVGPEKSLKLPVGHGKNSVWLTAGIIVADVVGAGILNMPVAVAGFGWALGAVAILLLLATNIHTAMLVWRLRMEFQEAQTYTELAEMVFKDAPRWQKNLAVTVTTVSQQTFIGSLLGAYVLTAGQGLGMALYDVQICLPWWALIACVCLIPFLGTARSMGSWKSLVWINIATLLGTIFIPLVWMVVMGVEEVRPEGSQVYAVAPLTPGLALNGLSTFMFAFTSQFMINEIITEMKDPSQLPKAYVKIAAPFQVLAFLIVGLGGYYYMGDQVSGKINENLPFGGLFRVAAACLVIHMLISYLIKSVVFCQFMHGKVDSENSRSESRRGWLGWNAVVGAVLFSAWLLANLVPFFGDFVDLLGASVTPVSCFTVPVVLYVKWYMNGGKEKGSISKAEWVLLGLELAFSLILAVFGTIHVLQDIVHHWESYGYPFQCHCHGLWNTCECSASNAGMIDVCSAP